MAAPKKVDYEAIEPGWRAGIKSPSQLAADYTARTGVNVSRSAIIKHFERLGVPRDLSAKVHAKAEAMVAEAMVTGKVSTATTLTDSVVIDSAATEVATVRLAHRSDINRGRRLCMSLLAELEAQTSDVPALQRLGKILRSEDDKGQDRLNDVYQAVISLPERTKTMKALADSLKVLIALEREAFNITPADDPADAIKGLAIAFVEATHARE